MTADFLFLKTEEYYIFKDKSVKQNFLKFCKFLIKKTKCFLKYTLTKYYSIYLEKVLYFGFVRLKEDHRKIIIFFQKTLLLFNSEKNLIPLL